VDKQELKLQYFHSGIKHNNSLTKVQSTPDIAPLFVSRKWLRVALYRVLLYSVEDETVEVRKRRLARERKKERRRMHWQSQKF